jgi:hypothetical protein
VRQGDINSRRLPRFCGFDRHAIRHDRLRSDKIADQKDPSRPVDVSPSLAWGVTPKPISWLDPAVIRGRTDVAFQITMSLPGVSSWRDSDAVG